MVINDRMSIGINDACMHGLLGRKNDKKLISNNKQSHYHIVRSVTHVQSAVIMIMIMVMDDSTGKQTNSDSTVDNDKNVIHDINNNGRLAAPPIHDNNDVSDAITHV